MGNLKPLVGVVIVNFNGAAFQNECVRSLIDCGYGNMRIIIVDNASTDNSLELLKEINDDRIIVIKNSENAGVAEGNNIGIMKSIELGCYYTLLLNNDTVLTEGFLNTLVSEDENIAVPKIYYYNTDKLLWYGGGVFVNWKGTTRHLYYKKKDEKITYKKYYDYAPTCCMLIKNSVFDEIGLVDGNYFLYYDDTDLVLRAKQNGYKIRFYNESIIYHKVSLSTGGDSSPVTLYYGNRNRFYYIKKNKLGTVAYLFTLLSRKLKIITSKLKGTSEWKYIKEAIKDYKNNKMYRKDNLKSIGES